MKNVTPLIPLRVETAVSTPLLTTEEIAQVLRCSPRHVRRLVEQAELPVVQISDRRRRFRLEDVLDWASGVRRPRQRMEPPAAHSAGAVEVDQEPLAAS